MKKNILRTNVEKMADVTYHTDGVMDIIPYSGEQIVREPQSRRGRLTMNEIGEATFKPYQDGVNSQQRTLFRAGHTTVKASKHSVIISFCFPQHLGLDAIRSAYDEESLMASDYLYMREEDQPWK